MIRAFCYTDDRRYEVDFDATPWFEQATNLAIVALAAQDFGGDYTADDVAIWTSQTNEALAELLDYANNPRFSQGFECHVDEALATLWVEQHRAYLLDRDGSIRTKPWGPKDWSPKEWNPKAKQKKPKKK
jgi:hypothetical protein